MEDKNANEERHERIVQVSCKGDRETAMQMDLIYATLVLAPLLEDFNRSLRGNVPWYAIQPMNENLVITFVGHLNRALGVPSGKAIAGMAGRFLYLFDHSLHRSQSKEGVDGWALCLDLPDDDVAPIMFLPVPSFCQSTLPKSMGSQVGGFIEWEVSIQRSFHELMDRLMGELGE